MLFVEAMLIGLAIAAPVGPIGLLCIERTLHHGPRSGLATGLGAASADAVYALLGATGSSLLIASLTRLALPLALAGSGVLAWLGWCTLRRAPAGTAATAPAAGTLWRAYSSALALTLTNPMTILSFMAVFAGLSAGRTATLAGSMVMVAGVFAGSALWWWVLAYGGGRLLARLGVAGRQRVDQLCGGLLLGFAVLLAWRALAG